MNDNHERYERLEILKRLERGCASDRDLERMVQLDEIARVRARWIETAWERVR